MVVLDSGFCVLKGLVEIKKRGVFAVALIKKRHYWPKYIDGKATKEHFKDLPVGSVDAMSGVLDGVPMNVFSMKGPDYLMLLMASYDSNERMGEEKREFGERGAES